MKYLPEVPTAGLYLNKTIFQYFYILMPVTVLDQYVVQHMQHRTSHGQYKTVHEHCGSNETLDLKIYVKDYCY